MQAEKESQQYRLETNKKKNSCWCVLCLVFVSPGAAAAAAQRPVLTGYGVVLASDWMTGSTGRTGSRSLWSSDWAFPGRTLTDRQWQPVQPTSVTSSCLFGYTPPPLPLPSPLSSPLIFFPSSLLLSVFHPLLWTFYWISLFVVTSDHLPPSHWLQYELAEQVEPAGSRESVGPEHRPLQPLHRRPGNLPHGVWEPLETGELHDDDFNLHSGC